MAEVKTGTGLPVNTAAALSYVFGWLSGIIIFLIEKDSYVRFHAMQSIITFGILSIAMMVPIIGLMLSPLLMILAFVLWIILIIKAYQGEKYKLPVVGDFAQKQAEKIK